MKASIKTIDINAKEWFDKTYGNSYFSAKIVINYGLKSQKSLFVPFSYGYGSHSEDVCFNKIKKSINKKILKDTLKSLSLWAFCKGHGILYRYSKQENCLKRELLTDKQVQNLEE